MGCNDLKKAACSHQGLVQCEGVTGWKGSLDSVKCEHLLKPSFEYREFRQAPYFCCAPTVSSAYPHVTHFRKHEPEFRRITCKQLLAA